MCHYEVIKVFNISNYLLTSQNRLSVILKPLHYLTCFFLNAGLFTCEINVEVIKCKYWIFGHLIDAGAYVGYVCFQYLLSFIALNLLLLFVSF